MKSPTNLPAPHHAEQDLPKNRNDPGRFFGDGVIFKAKLIGILEVGEARGDRMCQEALQDLKVAIRAAGEHKQRITIHVTIDGLRLRDEKTGDSLYHHPVHKISFIAQDMTDSRAFGYIFGSPDSGHRFFGIKTDKAASQVVLAMRDLFQVVFELKKKEIELARQNIQTKSILNNVSNTHSNASHPLQQQQQHQSDSNNLSNAIPLTSKGESSYGSGSTKMSLFNETSLMGSGGAYGASGGSNSGDLVDLEQELSSIQRGISQMERITPNEYPSKLDTDDPFGDSFTNSFQQPYNILPPPPDSTKSRHSKPLKPPTPLDRNASSNSPPLLAPPKSSSPKRINHKSESPKMLGEKTVMDHSPSWQDSSKSLFDAGSGQSKADLNDDPKPKRPPRDELAEIDYVNGTHMSQETVSAKKYVDAFTDLDPLGTGKNKPYVDKKYFFQDLKNPPKKVLKDLSSSDVNFTANFPSDGGQFQDDYESQASKPDQAFLSMMENNTFSTQSSNEADPFDMSATMVEPVKSNSNQDRSRREVTVGPSKDIKYSSGPLKVNLPPESDWHSKADSTTPPYDSTTSSVRNRPSSGLKHNTVDVISSIGGSKKMMKPHLFGQKFAKRDSNHINMKRLQESDSMSENEAPEPPPRPDICGNTEPPPLPPKKQFSDIVIRPSSASRSSYSSKDIQSRYESTDSLYNTKGNSGHEGPPLPLPSRRIGRTESTFPGPERPHRGSGRLDEEDDYLTPNVVSDMPIILPPPQSGVAKRAGRKQPLSNLDTEAETTQKRKPNLDSSAELPDITLSQLLTLGIDELADKLNVPAQKLSTMTIVELTKYLSEFLSRENAQKTTIEKKIPEGSVFKVSFDEENNEGTFVAVFDDNFGEELEQEQPFVANFDNMDIQPEPMTRDSKSSSDKYAAFREIMDNEWATENEDNSPRQEEETETVGRDVNEAEDNSFGIFENVPQISKIDTKITEAISHAKDRYAALRDIILDADLFGKSEVISSQNEEPASILDTDIDVPQEMAECEEISEEQDQSPEITIETAPSDEALDTDDIKKEKSFTPTFMTGREDVEIDELMNLAVSNLSLNNMSSLSPKPTVDVAQKNASTSPIMRNQLASPSPPEHKINVIDTSTSPIPLHASMSPVPLMPSSPQSPSVCNNEKKATDVEEPEGETNAVTTISVTPTPDFETEDKKLDSNVNNNNNNGSWAVFETEDVEKEIKSPRSGNNVESPCSSDGKDELKMMDKKWPTRHTSSSSRDVSPWDDDYGGNGGGESRRRPSPGITTDRQGHYMRHGRRMDSCDEDYEYEADYRRSKEYRRQQQQSGVVPPSWYHSQGTGEIPNWSPTEFEEGHGRRDRSFDRNSYERSTYGPPMYDKQDHSMKSYRNYEKRKFYANYGRKNYDYNERKSGADPEDIFDTSPSSFHRSNSRERMKREYYLSRERKSFDRESNDSYESGSGSNRKTKRDYREGCYGSMDLMRDDYGTDPTRNRYISTEKAMRNSRKSQSVSQGRRSKVDNYDDEGYEQEDSDGPEHRQYHGHYSRSYLGEGSRSLQRPSSSHYSGPSGQRPRKTSGSSPWDATGEPQSETTPVTSSQKAWNALRPSSASESMDRRRFYSSQILNVGSDNEKDRRMRMKTRGASTSSTIQLTTPRSAGHRRHENEFYFDCPNASVPVNSAISNERLSCDNFYSMSALKSPRGFETDSKTKTSRKGQSDRTSESEERRSRGCHQHSTNGSQMRKSNLRSSKKSTMKVPIASHYAASADDIDLDDENYENDPRFEYEDDEEDKHQQRFNYEEEQGFESDFIVNSPKQSNPSKGGSFRFSSDFTNQPFDGEFEKNMTTPPQQKLRFNDKIKVSKFQTNFGDDEALNEENQEELQDMFEDDFADAQLSQEVMNESLDQWNDNLPANRSKIGRVADNNNENIRKSESVNIFAKKYEDPFEDDDFFKTTEEGNENERKQPEAFNWDKNFAKFDENNL